MNIFISNNINDQAGNWIYMENFHSLLAILKYVSFPERFG